MLKIILPTLALLGGIIGLSAYLPQIRKLTKIKKSNQLSILTWSIWFFSSSLVLIYAISIKNFVYITLEVLDAFFIALILILIISYKD